MHNAFVSHLKVITSEVSLGHDERQYLFPKAFDNGFFRLSVGMEDAEDIIGDIGQALDAVGVLD